MASPSSSPKASLVTNHHGTNGFKVYLEIGNYQEVVMYCFEAQGDLNRASCLCTLESGVLRLVSRPSQCLSDVLDCETQ